MDEYDTMPQ